MNLFPRIGIQEITARIIIRICNTRKIKVIIPIISPIGHTSLKYNYAQNEATPSNDDISSAPRISSTVSTKYGVTTKVLAAILESVALFA